MAWIEKREGKKGISYRISVSCGFNSAGKQVMRHMTWKPESGMTPRQIEKSLLRVTNEFEQQIKQGYMLDQKKTFSEYAKYVLELKSRTGVRPRTLDRYYGLMYRIDAAIGHIKLNDLRPQHLNEFYKNLGEEGIRTANTRAISKIDITAWLNENSCTATELARRAGVSIGTLRSAKRGQAILQDKAVAISTAMNTTLDKAFVLEKDTSPLSNKTILEYHRLISSIMAQAEKELLIPYNPAAKATPPKIQRKTPDYYQPETIQEILAALDTAPLKWKTITYLLIDSGCRRGEAAGLKWENVDFTHDTILIERSLLYSPKRGVYEGPPKTGISRALKLAPETITLLKQYQSQQEEWRASVGDRWVETGFVFTQETGIPINPDTITDWLAKFSKARGLPHIHPHAFRHTAASTMIAAGIDLVTTANELGHANATTTATIYAHQITSAKARASEVRSGIFKK